jgi:hypothetical protein
MLSVVLEFGLLSFTLINHINKLILNKFTNQFYIHTDKSLWFRSLCSFKTSDDCVSRLNAIVF